MKKFKAAVSFIMVFFLSLSLLAPTAVRGNEFNEEDGVVISDENLEGSTEESPNEASDDDAGSVPEEELAPDAEAGGDEEAVHSQGEGDTQLSEKQRALNEIIEEDDILALIYLEDSLSIRRAPSASSDVVVTVPSGKQVYILDLEINENYERWAYVSLLEEGLEYKGYIPRNNIACSDSRFLEWEQEYVPAPRMLRSFSNAAASADDISQFPESYRAALSKLKQEHPNWVFVKMETGLNWNTVVEAELQGARSLVYDSSPEYMKRGVYGQGWSYASKNALEYYLDPRNWIVESNIFMFEYLTYNERYHSIEPIQTLLTNTFMNSALPKDEHGRTYAQVFYDVGRELRVSPFHLACRVYFEQGVKGTSPLISGTYAGYENLYNYYNVGASGDTNEAVFTSGLAKAREKGWTTPYLSIHGGASLISNSYIKKGQNTIYLQKFDVDSSDNQLYWHQYMQNIMGPSSESRKMREQYVNAGVLNETFVFRIPVYNNMPASPCQLSTVSNEIVLTQMSGYTDPVIYLDGKNYGAVLKNGHFSVTAPNGDFSTAIMYKYDNNNIPTGMYVWTLNYSGGSYTATPVPEFENLLSYHGFSIRITGKSGIRFKTGISRDTRNALATTGISGYHLNEYGTIVMNNSNRSQYSFVKGGEKVSGKYSYGINSNGQLESYVYEIVNDRLRYTSVLVGVPKEEYKTEFAFRGYIILNKDGRQITLYGPPMYRSIYSLAKRIMGDGDYKEGTPAYLFIKQIIDDCEQQANAAAPAPAPTAKPTPSPSSVPPVQNEQGKDANGNGGDKQGQSPQLPEVTPGELLPADTSETDSSNSGSTTEPPQADSSDN